MMPAGNACLIVDIVNIQLARLTLYEWKIHGTHILNYNSCLERFETKRSELNIVAQGKIGQTLPRGLQKRPHTKPLKSLWSHKSHSN